MRARIVVLLRPSLPFRSTEQKCVAEHVHGFDMGDNRCLGMPSRGRRTRDNLLRLTWERDSLASIICLGRKGYGSSLKHHTDSSACRRRIKRQRFRRFGSQGKAAISQDAVPTLHRDSKFSLVRPQSAGLLSSKRRIAPFWGVNTGGIAAPINRRQQQLGVSRSSSSRAARTWAVMTAASSSMTKATERSRPCGPVMSTLNPPRNGSTTTHASCGVGDCSCGHAAASIRSLLGCPSVKNSDRHGFERLLYPFLNVNITVVLYGPGYRRS